MTIAFLFSCIDPLHLNHFEYTVLTPPETLDLSAAVNYDVIQTVAWRRDGQVVVDSGSRVLVEASSADLFGNYTVRAVSPQGVVYEEWTLVAAYGMHISTCTKCIKLQCMEHHSVVKY